MTIKTNNSKNLTSKQPERFITIDDDDGEQVVPSNPPPNPQNPAANIARPQAAPTLHPLKILPVWPAPCGYNQDNPVLVATGGEPTAVVATKKATTAKMIAFFHGDSILGRRGAYTFINFQAIKMRHPLAFPRMWPKWAIRAIKMRHPLPSPTMRTKWAMAIKMLHLLPFPTTIWSNWAIQQWGLGLRKQLERGAHWGL